MKYIRHLAVALLLCLLLALPVMAFSSVTDFSGSAQLSGDGNCQFSLMVTVSLDTDCTDLTFPLPGNASHVLLNGQAAQTYKDGDKLQVQLPTMTAGQHVLLLSYELPCTVTLGKKTILTMPLLSGFSLPIDNLEFTVTLPGSLTGDPVFISGYHQQNIQVDTVLTGNSLNCRVETALKDHETLSAELPVDPDDFRFVNDPRFVNRWDLAMVGIIALAMAYYCLTLLPKFARRSRSFTAPEGITAGEVGCCLTGSGTDLGMMALTWAQLGYIQIETDRRGRIFLHKQMEMGNERSYHEGHIFQILFSRRQTVDATSVAFGRLSWKVAGRSPLQRQLFRARSGDMRIFRGLCCAAAVCCGAQMGAGSVFLAIVMALVCGVFSILIQLGCRCIPLRNKMPLLAAVTGGVLWCVMGGVSNTLSRVIPMVLFQFLAGIFGAYGGKRSDMGQVVLSQLLGLRRHLSEAKSYDMQALQQKNPYYFYELAPYALAMGVDRQFARRFDAKAQLPECGWLKNAPRMTPAQYAANLRRLADAMYRSRFRKS